MARPTREEEEKVDREIRKIRKKLSDKELKKYRQQFKEVVRQEQRLTEFTSWKPRYTDPKRAYNDSITDHWAKKRVEANVVAARHRLREQSAKEGTSGWDESAGGSKLPTGHPVIWSTDQVCVQEQSFPEMVKASLMPDLPGDLNLERSKRHSKALKDLPNNPYHYNALDPYYRYWITKDKDASWKLSTGPDRNDLPI